MRMHELPESCKNCKNLRCFSAYMDGSADYACNRKVMCEHWKKHMNDKRKNCPIRHENGNCTSIGGFCMAVNDGICEGLRNAYKAGTLNRQANNSNWHTGKPTEEGWYFCLVDTGSGTKFMANEWKDIVGCQWVYGFHGEIIAWRKAEDPINILNEVGQEGE